MPRVRMSIKDLVVDIILVSNPVALGSIIRVSKIFLEVAEKYMDNEKDCNKKFYSELLELFPLQWLSDFYQ